MKHITTYEVAGNVLIKENGSQCLTEKKLKS